MKITLDTLAAALTEVDVWVDAYPADTVLALWEARAWEMLDLQSWEALCDSRGWTRRVALPRPERQEIVGRLRQEGMSTRAIAAATGASVGTVHSDIASGVQDRTPAAVVGTDGKTYQSSRPSVIEPEVITADEFMAREGYATDELAARRTSTDAERDARRAHYKAQAIRQRNLDLNVGFSTISELKHPHILDEVLQNWQPLSTDWTPAMLHDLADLLHQIADRWKVTA